MGKIVDIVVTPASRINHQGTFWFYVGRCAMHQQRLPWSERWNQRPVREVPVAEYESEDGMERAWFKYRDDYEKIES